MTLEEKITNAKKFYIGKYGKLDWKFYDEGVIYAIEDYISSTGEITPADWDYAIREEICEEVAFVEREFEEEVI